MERAAAAIWLLRQPLFYGSSYAVDLGSAN